MLTTKEIAFDRNEAMLLEPSNAAYLPNPVVVPAGTECKILRTRKALTAAGEEDRVEWLVQVQVSDRPGDVAFAWLPKGEI